MSISETKDAKQINWRDFKSWPDNYKMYGGIGGGLLLVIIAFAFMIKSGTFEKAKNVR